MPSIVRLLVWAVVIATVAFLVVREIRSGRKGPAELDRDEREAVREAGMNRDARGPHGGASMWG